MLNNVVTNVTLETRSGLDLNSNANIVVVAAVGMAAKIINTFPSKSDTGNNITQTHAITGMMISLMAVPKATFQFQTV